MTQRRKKPNAFVGLSGGVDSAVTAALLKKAGYEVTGVFMRQYDTAVQGAGSQQVHCTWLEDRRDAIAVAAHLDISFHEWDFRREYQDSVVEYLFREYQAGRTPNPDVMCNTFVKFGAFLRKARAHGADYIATGHYVRINTTTRRGRDVYHLKTAADKEKDQSYFLYGLTQDQLQYCLFPLGDYKKTEVRALARQLGLPNAEKKDSQGICFVGKIPMKDFLQTRIETKPGPIMTLTGEVVGRHEGAALSTIGQRHGIGSGGGGAVYFVVEKDVKNNIIYVAAGEDNPALFKKHLDCEAVHWISGDPIPGSGVLSCSARIRYRQPLQPCEVRAIAVANGSEPAYHVTFADGQRAISPGQAIVFYAGRSVLGGGIIV